jgi:hypothetical protein
MAETVAERLVGVVERPPVGDGGCRKGALRVKSVAVLNEIGGTSDESDHPSRYPRWTGRG